MTTIDLDLHRHARHSLSENCRRPAGRRHRRHNHVLDCISRLGWRRGCRDFSLTAIASLQRRNSGRLAQARYRGQRKFGALVRDGLSSAAHRSCKRASMSAVSVKYASVAKPRASASALTLSSRSIRSSARRCRLARGECSAIVNPVRRGTPWECCPALEVGHPSYA